MPHCRGYPTTGITTYPTVGGTPPQGYYYDLIAKLELLKTATYLKFDE